MKIGCGDGDSPYSVISSMATLTCRKPSGLFAPTIAFHFGQDVTRLDFSLAMPQLTILYDGACPLCLREVRFLRSRDPGGDQLAFVDIDAADYIPADHGGIDYRMAMARIHAIAADGSVLRDVEVFCRAYALVGLGWLYAPSRWPLLAPLANGAYNFWARVRLRLTGRPDLEQLCEARSKHCERERCQT